MQINLVYLKKKKFTQYDMQRILKAMYKIKERGGEEGEIIYCQNMRSYRLIPNLSLFMHAWLHFFLKITPPPSKTISPKMLGITRAEGGGDIDLVPLPPSYANED